MTSGTRAPDHIESLRDSFALHLEANGMPTGVGAVCREHIESYLDARRPLVKPATLSIEYRALAKFWRWAVDEDEVAASPMAKMKPPTVPETRVPVVAPDDFRKLLRTAEGTGYNERRDTATLVTFYDTGGSVTSAATSSRPWRTARLMTVHCVPRRR
jgi:site-specific recombinase XerD